MVQLLLFTEDMTLRPLALLVALGALAGAGCRSDINRSATAKWEPSAVAAQDAETGAAIERILRTARHPWMRWPSLADVAPSLEPMYTSEPDRLLWFDGDRPSRALQPTLETIALAGDYGLDPGDYDASVLTDRWAALKARQGSAADRASFDLAVSAAVARMLTAVGIGRVDPATMDWGYDIAPKQFDVPSAVQHVRDGQPLGAELDRLQPSFPHYARARQTLAVYRALARSGEPPVVRDLPKGRSLKPGAHWDGVPELAARLHAVGDLPDAATMPADRTVYASPVIDAVKSFQRRHGLEPDGTIGAATIRMLNVPLVQRIRQIELAMERMRWLPDLGNEPNIFVNVALFRMWATDPAGKEEPLRMNVVVGKSLDHKTPIFVDRMEYVIFRPYWNPPKSILVDEILPRARREPSYLYDENLEIVSNGADDATPLPNTPENLDGVEAGRLTLRQRPGPKNSLGLVKFLFPNTDDVYMHGTPATQLFDRVRRDFSHGCIRVEDPEKLAAWVLRDQPEWTAEKIEAAMQAETPTRVNLKQKPMVVIFYDTVHVNSENVVFFVDDIYGLDRALDAALKRGYPYPTRRGKTPREPT